MTRLQAALLGGLFIGVLSSLPVVNIANCCCLWVIVGGVLTVYLQQQGRTTAIAPADAALSGLLAGLVGALISLALTAVFFSMTGAGMAAQFREMAEQYPQMPAETRDMIIRLSEGSGMFLLLSLFTIPIYAIVSMLGGLLGTLIFRKPAPPTPPPPAQV